ncbi:leucine-rich repeat and calponin homology domain-containing protein isoform X2 [Hyalella azteca]|uniref:Leucine-rich repeat and calponin homology domain-containing protein isoform X2 n=1 Tax=Hyalella azteca TaxID=294128 RepID=A0A979FGT2_HYAAZ|nr:leucine-rich repeat and calponin homology domain-containing protein isoform X2 [Hyalella azteca]
MAGLHSGRSATTIARTLDRILEESVLTGELFLCGRKIKEYPKNASKYNLSDTVIADFSHNRLCEVPCEVCSYHWLEKLLIHHNAIKQLPAALASLSQLTLLDVSRNQLSDIPSCINQLSNLRILNLSDNRLTNLPSNLGCGLPHLTQLDVSHNQLTGLPASLGHLHHLRSLLLRRNKLQTLPPEVCYLRLSVLDLSSNNITALPSDLRFMLSLTTLLLSDNPLLCPPTQVCARGRVHVFKWLELSAGKEGRRTGVQELEQRRNRKHLQQQQQLALQQQQLVQQQQLQLQQQHLQQLQHPDISRVLSEASAGQRTTVDSGYSDTCDFNRWPCNSHEVDDEAGLHDRLGRLSLSGSSTPSTLSPTDAGLSLEDEVHKAMQQRMEFDLLYCGGEAPLPPPHDNTTASRGRSCDVEDGVAYSPASPSILPHLTATAAPASPSTVPTYKDYLEAKRQQRALEAGRVYRSAAADGVPSRPDSLPSHPSNSSYSNGNWSASEADRAHVKTLQKEAVLSYVKSRVSPTKESLPGSPNTSFDSAGAPESPVPPPSNGLGHQLPVSSYLHSPHGPTRSPYPSEEYIQASHLSGVNSPQSIQKIDSSGVPNNAISNCGRPTTLTSSRSSNRLINNSNGNNNGNRSNGASGIPTLKGSSNTPSPTSPISPSIPKSVAINTRFFPSTNNVSSTVNNTRNPSTRSNGTNKSANGKIPNGSTGSSNSNTNRTAINGSIRPAAATPAASNTGKTVVGNGVSKAPMLAQQRRRGSGAGLVGSGIPGSTNGVRGDAGLDGEAPSKLGFTYRREMEKQQHEKLLLDNLRNIIESRLKVTLPSNMGSALVDGVVLCHLVNHVRPRAVPSIHVPSPAVPKLTVAKCRLNVESFLEACKKIGVEEDLLFTADNIVEPPFDVELVLATVHRLVFPDQPLPHVLQHLLPPPAKSVPQSNGSVNLDPVVANRRVNCAELGLIVSENDMEITESLEKSPVDAENDFDTSVEERKRHSDVAVEFGSSEVNVERCHLGSASSGNNNTAMESSSDRPGHRVNSLVIAFESRLNSLEGNSSPEREKCSESSREENQHSPTEVKLLSDVDQPDKWDPTMTEITTVTESRDDSGSAAVDVLNTKRLTSGGSLDLSVPDLVTSTNGCNKLVPMQGSLPHKCASSVLSDSNIGVGAVISHARPVLDKFSVDAQSAFFEVPIKTVDETLVTPTSTAMATAPLPVRDDRLLSLFLLAFFILSSALLIMFPIGQ